MMTNGRDDMAKQKVGRNRNMRSEAYLEGIRDGKAGALDVITYWKNAAICEKPRGSCRLCPTTNCYGKELTERLSG
jgi:hypothetical protein